MMWSPLLFIGALGCGAARAQDDSAEIDSLIAEVFGVKDKDINAECDAVVDGGRLEGCAECYPCGHRAVAGWPEKDLVEVTINNSSCHPTRLCCVRQAALLSSRIGQQCGARRRTGAPRLAPRAVSEGEYPWHAYLYGSDSKRPLCAATYVDAARRALLTTAACARAGPRAARFWRGGRAAAVAAVVVHEDYGSDSGSNVALVTLREAPPPYAAPACLPPRPAALAAPCLTIAANDYLIQNKIPRRELCGGRGGAELCAAGAGGDHEPAAAAGLLCEARVKRASGRALLFELHGVYLHTDAKHTGVTFYLNTSHYIDWINEKLGL